MLVHKVKCGYKWGKSGKVYPTKKQANKQARAIYASGYKKKKTRRDAMKKWMKAAGIRALKTIAQTAVATISMSTLISDVDWLLVCSTSILAGLLSILTSIAGLPEVNN
jgi:fatty acid desaturase